MAHPSYKHTYITDILERHTVLSVAYSHAGTVCPLKMSVSFYQAIQHYMPEDNPLLNYCCEDLRSYIITSVCSHILFLDILNAIICRMACTSSDLVLTAL
jgi:hypothetical protein